MWKYLKHGAPFVNMFTVREFPPITQMALYTTCCAGPKMKSPPCSVILPNGSEMVGKILE